MALPATYDTAVAAELSAMRTALGIQTYEGFVATGGKLSEAKLAAPNNHVQGRRRRRARSTIFPGAKFYYDNFYGPTETGSGGNLTLKVGIEYPIGGAFYLLDFSGSSTTVIADQGTGVGLYTGPVIPEGAEFNEWPLAQFTNGALYCQTSSRIDGAQIAVSVTDRTTSGGALSGTDFIYCATAIVGPTIKPSVLILGDSRDCVAYQLYGLNDPGAVSRVIGGSYGYCNIATSGAAMYQFRDNATSRLTKYLAFATHIIHRGYINDCVGGSSTTATNAAALKSTLQDNIVKWGAGKINIVCTVEPYTTGTYASDGAQTIWDANKNAARVLFNNEIRGGTIVGAAGYWDTADAAESARDNGLWYSGSGQAHTNDGLHGNTRMQGKFAKEINLGMIG